MAKINSSTLTIGCKVTETGWRLVWDAIKCAIKGRSIILYEKPINLTVHYVDSVNIIGFGACISENK